MTSIPDSQNTDGVPTYVQRRRSRWQVHRLLPGLAKEPG
jgi:hypothetical protein